MTAHIGPYSPLAFPSFPLYSAHLGEIRSAIQIVLDRRIVFRIMGADWTPNSIHAGMAKFPN